MREAGRSMQARRHFFNSDSIFGRIFGEEMKVTEQK